LERLEASPLPVSGWQAAFVRRVKRNPSDEMESRSIATTPAKRKQRQTNGLFSPREQLCIGSIRVIRHVQIYSWFPKHFFLTAFGLRLQPGRFSSSSNF
jgi:hypothetical protein